VGRCLHRRLSIVFNVAVAPHGARRHFWGKQFKYSMAKLCKSLQSTVKGLFTSTYRQFLILGVSGAGKTTLMYRLKFASGNWETMEEDLEMMRTQRGMDRTPEEGPGPYGPDDYGYHYEEFNMMGKCSMWDLCGIHSLRYFWKVVYESIEVHGIFFVVDGNDHMGICETLEPRRDRAQAKQNIAEARQELHTLLHEDCLRRGFFAVLVNQRKPREEGKNTTKEKPGMSRSELKSWWQVQLGVGEDLHESLVWQTRVFVLDCDKLEDEEDPDWKKVLDFAQETLAVSKENKGFGVTV